MSLTEFLENHYKLGQEYRLRFDSRDNYCNYIDMSLVRIPDFYLHTPIPVASLNDLFYSRLWVCNSKYKYLYIYLFKDGESFFADRDNLRILDFKKENDRMNINFSCKQKCLQFPWTYKKIQGQDKKYLIRG